MSLKEHNYYDLLICTKKSDKFILSEKEMQNMFEGNYLFITFLLYFFYIINV